MKKLLITFIAITCITFSMSAQQLRTGILLGGGAWGGIDAKANASTIEKFNNIENNFKSSFMLGYRFRLHHNSMPGFLDLDAVVGLKNWSSSYRNGDYDYGNNPGDESQMGSFSAKSNYVYTGISATANYYVLNKLSLGVGVEPSVWISKQGENNSKTFDMPLVAKIGYDFKFIELGFTYKYSFINSVKTPYLDSGKFNDLQFSIWIPF